MLWASRACAAEYRNDAGSQAQGAGMAGQQAQDGESVSPPGFAGPEGVVAQSLGVPGKDNQFLVGGVLPAAEGQRGGIHLPELKPGSKREA